ncbi:heme peroxidase [Byssothecium circinans]|uniref:Peroxidase n=1 Tax=Byssothecium circinans TaxID=147558 RepID=A0A6A5TEE4_9PLEO|nr:heme peroxidase [Byssothecium circinans]
MVFTQAAPSHLPPTAPPPKPPSTYPPVWASIAADLQSSMMSQGTCTNLARQTVRLSFHDCFPGSCDGSIILANECTTRVENNRMVEICDTLGAAAPSYNVTTADLIQFAAAIGIASCSSGPITSFYAGRTDSFTASLTGQVPGANANANALVSQFAAKGFTTTELVALTGSHTIGRNRGGAIDSTIGKWDSGFYGQVSKGTAPNPIPADVSLSNSTVTMKVWNAVRKSQGAFDSAFVPAMEKMSLMGWRKADLVDRS